MKFAHVKKGDKVIVNCGEFKGMITIVSGIFRFKNGKKPDTFKVALSDLPKRSIKNKKTGVVKQVDRLVHSSNVELLSQSSN
jgi:ribosomal protein L24